MTARAPRITGRRIRFAVVGRGRIHGKHAIEHGEFAEPDEEDGAQVTGASYGTASVYGVGHPLYYDNVIGALRGEQGAETDGRQGLESLELLVGIYLSARNGRPVALPLDV